MEAQISLDRILEFCKTRDVYPGHGEIVTKIKNATKSC